jgi:hypothetical protein
MAGWFISNGKSHELDTSHGDAPKMVRHAREFMRKYGDE